MLRFSKVLLAGTISFIVFYSEMLRNPDYDPLVDWSLSAAFGLFGAVLLLRFETISKKLLLTKIRKEDDGPMNASVAVEERDAPYKEDRV